MWEVGYCDIDGYVFKGEDYLQISVDEQNNQCAAVTKEAIDLSAFDQLSFWSRLGVLPLDAEDEYTNDISTLDGQYYVHLHYVGGMSMGSGYVVVSTEKMGDVNVYDFKIKVPGAGGSLLVSKFWFQ